MLAKIESLRTEANGALAALDSLVSLQEFKVRFLGKKGLLTDILKSLSLLGPEERPIVGEAANRAKTEIESRLESLRKNLDQKERSRLQSQKQVDVSLPGLKLPRGFRHPLSLVEKEIESIFVNMGFSVFEGPDIESDYYNFEALNFPADHPAREMQDTFYIGPRTMDQGQRTQEKVHGPWSMVHGPLLLRTHTSPVQIRTMEKQKPPIYMICPGAVYRHDDDVTHSPMFHQVEGLMVDRHLTFGDLKGVLTLFCQTIFGKKLKTRFRPSFFPFVEPGAEVDISCVLCAGKGCRVCGGDGWLEILGAGMVHPAVLEQVKIDPKKFTGFAFGMGVERIAMLKYGIDDIRLFYQSDMRFLEQF
ncbi:MAG: phenylalanine--tRNA ligase subunit alpha [Deltaproteobacteria bacterium]|nr:phenylalanine--tRNA ligase subunit alpha [Deltaproteobacteria bacterium]MDZ4224323.1 phenylalanine--tRNA ligase subunit alpha [bacterium]